MSSAINRRTSAGLAPILALVLLVGCSGSASIPSASARPPESLTPTASVARSLSVADAWAEDLDRLDQMVRNSHVAPFVIHGEAEWAAKLG